MRRSSTIFITGSTDGLGRALAESLATAGNTLILHGRCQQKLDSLAESLTALGAENSQTVQADLADLDEVRRMATHLKAVTPRIDVLVNNAGIGSGEPDGCYRRTSADGYELRLAVNYLAGFLLTLELLPLLRESAPARVVNVSSLGQVPLDFEDLMLERGYDGTRAYCQSKLAQILFTFELADRLSVQEVTVNSLHPATYMPTKIVLKDIGHSVDSLEQGVDATRRLVTSPELAGVSGRFFDRDREVRAQEQAYDRTARERLWQASLDLTQATPTV